MEEEKDFLLKRYEYTLKNFTDSTLGFGLIEANTAISSIQRTQEQTQLALPEQQKIQK